MNVAALQQAIQDLGYTTDTAAQQLGFINAAYREIHSQARWPFLEAVDTSQSTASGTPNYTPPMANWRNFDSVRIASPTTRDFPDIDYRSPQDLFDWLHRDPLTLATPRWWTAYASQLWFYPTPDAAYQITYNYITEPADLVVSTDVPLVPVAYHDAIVAGAVCRIAYRERDWIGLELWTQKYDKLVTALKDEYKLRQRQTSSEVRRSGFFNNEVNYPLSSTGF